jgi:hypothetical protein
MVLINEWLPNPTGVEAAGEFVELFNNGDAPVDLRGWTLVTTGIKKRVKLSGVVPANGYLVLPRTQTKLVLKNSDEGLALYDAQGNLADQSSFAGSAPEGKSFNRISNPSQASRPQTAATPSLPLEGEGLFAWGEPTPGAANHVMLANTVAAVAEPVGVPLNHAALGAGGFAGAMLGVAALLVGLVMYSIKVNENLSELFFGGDEGARP